MSPGRREALILGLAGVAAAAAGFLAGPALLGGGEGEGEVLRRAAFPDLAGKRRELSEWGDKVLVCNFWATWCAPCREEIPLLVASRRKFAPAGVEIVGIAVDNADKVRQFSAKLDISYPILIADGDGLELMRRLGNTSGGLPFTVIADRGGRLVHHKLGALKGTELDDILRPMT